MIFISRRLPSLLPPSEADGLAWIIKQYQRLFGSWPVPGSPREARPIPADPNRARIGIGLGRGLGQILVGVKKTRVVGAGSNRKATAALSDLPSLDRGNFSNSALYRSCSRAGTGYDGPCFRMPTSTLF
jgi:hypothetical protein